MSLVDRSIRKLSIRCEKLLKTFLLASLLGAMFLLLYWITGENSSDPCSEQSRDIAAAIMSDNPQEQEDLVNRALLMRGVCDAK